MSATKFLTKLWEKKDLTADESSTLMSLISEGQLSPVQVSALLTALYFKGETVDEIFGFAREMQKRALHVVADKTKMVVDTCGTGGDAKNTFNISTAVAFVVAAAGLQVAKHGNRAITSNSGSADFLENLGVNLNLSVEEVSQCLQQVGMGFLFAPQLHHSMKNVVKIRRELKMRTIFNVLGPLTNPARAEVQIVGVFATELTEKLAKVLLKLGVKSGMVVCGRDGLDEITLTTTTKITQWQEGELKTYDFDPANYGFSYCQLCDLTADENVDIVQDILSPTANLSAENSYKRDIVVLNAAAVFLLTAKSNSWQSGIDLAREMIFSGKVRTKVKELVDFTNQFILNT